MDSAQPILRCFALLLLLAAACVPVAGQRIEIPTLAVLPTETPTPSDTPTMTFTPLPTDTPTPRPSHTPDIALSQIAGLKQTNAAAQATLDTLLTQAAPTLTPVVSNTPTAAAISPQWVYAQSSATLRICPSSVCEMVGQLHEGEAVSADGTIDGEALIVGNSLWYRVAWSGGEVFVYSTQISLAPPTLPLVDAPPTFTPLPSSTPVPTTVPILISTPVPQQPAAGCPDVHATCSQLTCAQAYACLAAGNTKLDADKDGMPCESICK